MVRTVRPKASATPTSPMSISGNFAASTALPQPPKTSQKVPMNSAPSFFDNGMAAPPVDLRAMPKHLQTGGSSCLCHRMITRVRDAIGLRGAGSRAVDQHQFGVFERAETQQLLITDSGPVARLDPDAVDVESAGRRHEVEVSHRARRVFDRLARFQPGAQHPRIGADRQGLGVGAVAAAERDESAGPVGLWKRPVVPAGLTAAT